MLPTMKTRALTSILALLALAFAASASTYTLQWGDTLIHVAKRFGVPVSTVAAANGINNPDHVVAGRTLSLPSGQGPAPAPIAGATAAGAVHVVQPGENLTLIARRFGTTVSELQHR
ncbi:MAG: LysM peptidoglycan-binding domain-containing protein, partial [Acidimicrobiales bacterium]